MLNRRYREILSMILNTDGYITGNELAKLCNVSVRTIRIDIKEINNLLEEYNIKVDSEVKKGYYLSEDSKEVLMRNNIIRAVLDYEYIIETPNTPFDRRMYILLKLTTKDYILINELIEELYVSESTISNDIIYIKKWLKDNVDMNLNNSLYKGISIKGNEEQKRNIISWVLGRKCNGSTLGKYLNYLFSNSDILKSSDKIYPIVERETKKYGYFLSGHGSQMFVNDLLVACKRYALGYRIEENSDDTEFIPVIKALRNDIEKVIDTALPNVEWLNLQHRFKAKQFINGTDINNIKTEEAVRVVEEICIILREKYNIDLTQIEGLRYKFLLYIAPMINRAKSKYGIPNSMNEDTSELYPLEFKMAKEISNLIRKSLDISISSSEIHYITVLLASINDYWNKKLNLIIVCDFDETIVTLIKKNIKDKFHKTVEICGHYTYQQFKFGDKSLFKDIDLIVTTSTLADLTDINFIQVNPVMNPRDMDNLQEYLSNLP
ncbi:transcription antiterminator [Clostridium intestinale]|uniref:BglG family transcription antiterminator n=1 Tax=Clostridium intestinale TaxID=36845 RepID=UPI0028E52E1E|nr:transcription antiterminator [Clostridium intestinale]